MNTLYQDGKAIIMKKVGYICLILCALLIVSGCIWGKEAIALLKGPKEWEIYESLLYENAQVNVKDAYMEADIDMITGSYAEYGDVKEGEMKDKTVYYLMPVNDGEYFVTVIGYGKDVEILDDMERYFYDSIGSENKQYPQPFHIEGGLKKLAADELLFALDYFKSYDSSIQAVEDLPNILSPYAIVIDQINAISIESLWALWIGWILVFFLLILCIVLYGSKLFMRPLVKDIKELNDQLRDSIDEDYPKATEYENVKIGKKLLYVKNSWTMHVYDYERFIWIYQKEILGKKKRSFEVCIYDKSGKKYVLWQGEEQRKAQKICEKVFDHCENALLGYQGYLYEFWKEHPEKLYDKCLELALINKKMAEKTQKKKKASKSTTGKKHSAKQRKVRNRSQKATKDNKNKQKGKKN